MGVRPQIKLEDDIDIKVFDVGVSGLSKSVARKILEPNELSCVDHCIGE